LPLFPYAQRIGAPFIFLTNGELIYFWDKMMMRVLLALLSQRDLERLVEMRSTRKPPLPLSFLSTMFGKEKLGLFAPHSAGSDASTRPSS